MMGPGIRVAQLNMNGQFIVAEQLRDYCIKNQIDVVLVQEPPLTSNRMVVGFENADFRTVMSRAGRATVAIIVINPGLGVVTNAGHTGEHFAVASITWCVGARSGLTVVSAYFKYSKATEVFCEKLRKIVETRPKVLIGVDSNGHSPLWFCPDRNSRGRIIKDTILDCELRISNLPSELTTFERGERRSNIDLTLTSSDFTQSV